MRETHIRSIFKALTWRAIAAATTMGLVYLSTKDFSLTLEVGIFDILLKLIFYYFHERAWNKTSWGKYIHKGKK